MTYWEIIAHRLGKAGYPGENDINNPTIPCAVPPVFGLDGTPSALASAIGARPTGLYRKRRSTSMEHSFFVKMGRHR